MIHFSEFSGIGGFDLAAEWSGWENYLSCEINPFCNQVLEYYWPNAYHHRDIRTLNYETVNAELSRRIGPGWRNQRIVLSGGFPCQGFSMAGKRLGTEDNRYLWPEMRRTYRQFKPAAIVGENVTGILSMEDKSGVWREVFPRVEGRKIVRYDTIDHYEAVYTRQAKMLVSTICENLEEDGYTVQPIVIPAGGIGAPHRRERIWFLAHSNSDGHDAGGNGPEQSGCAKSAGPAVEEQRERIRDVPGRNVSARNATDASSTGFQGNVRGQQPSVSGSAIGHARREFGGIHTAIDGWKDFPTQSPICSGNDGFPSDLDGITFSSWRNESLRAAGNAIVPQVAYQIFQAIQNYYDCKL